MRLLCKIIELLEVMLVCDGLAWCILLWCKIKQLLYGFNEDNLTETSFHLIPFVSLLLIQALSISVEVLMKCGDEKDMTSRNVDKLRQLLHEIHLSFRILLGGMFKYLTKLIDEDDKELTLWFDFVIIATKMVNYVFFITHAFKFFTQQSVQGLVITNDI